MKEQVISAVEAARIYKKITGHRRSPKCIEADVRYFHSLGSFDYSRPCAEGTLVGIRRGRWEYFVATRLLMRGQRCIFSKDGPDPE